MKPKLKILILSHSSELAGAERSMVDLFDYWMKEHVVEPHFIIRRPIKNLAKELRRRGWPYTALYYTNWSQRNPSKRAQDIHRNALFNTKAIFKIEQIIKDFKPDVVMTNTIVSPWAAIAAYFQRVPHVWFVREYGDIDHQHVFELGRARMLQDINTLSSLIVTNSNTLAKHIRPSIDKTKLTTLYTPFNVNQLRQKSLEKAKNPFKNKDSLKLVITGKIAPSKGQAEAAEAVARLIEQGFEAELCIIGKAVEPNDAKPLQDAINKYNLHQKVHLIGHQPNPLSILKYADVGIMASKQEAFGRVTFEYMTIGLPVIGTNSGATPEMIEAGVNGYLYDQGSVDSLVEQLSKYAQNRDLIKMHGQAAEQKASKMMNNQYGAKALFKKIAPIAQAKDQYLPQPLNFAHRWLEYPSIAQQYIKDTDVIALYRLAYLRFRHAVKVALLWFLDLFTKDQQLPK